MENVLIYWLTVDVCHVLYLFSLSYKNETLRKDMYIRKQQHNKSGILIVKCVMLSAIFFQSH